jgi:hypothetical protein
LKRSLPERYTAMCLHMADEAHSGLWMR